MPINVSVNKQEIWLLSLERARKERVRVWLTKKGWRARSTKGVGKKPPSGEVYTLMAHTVLGNAINIICSCMGWGSRGYCKHAARLAVLLSKRGETIRLD